MVIEEEEGRLVAPSSSLTPQEQQEQQQQQAVDAISQLSLSSSAAAVVGSASSDGALTMTTANSPVEKFDPRPIKMSRGNTSSLDSFDDGIYDDDDDVDDDISNDIRHHHANNNNTNINYTDNNNNNQQQQKRRDSSQLEQAAPAFTSSASDSYCARTPVKDGSGSTMKGCSRSNSHNSYHHQQKRSSSSSTFTDQFPSNMKNHIGTYKNNNNTRNGIDDIQQQIGSSSHSYSSESRYSQNGENDNNGGGGRSILLAPITGAWGWIQKQNEKQKKKHLRELAEEQVQILKEAQKGGDPNNSIDFTVIAAGVGVVGGDDNNSDNDEEGYRTPQRSQRGGSLHDSSSFREDEDDISWIPAVRVVEEQVKKDYTPSPRSSRTAAAGDTLSSPDPTKPIPFVLNQAQMDDIARYVLPKGIAFCRWQRLYSLTRDGDSFWQCLRLCGSEPKTLLVVKTTRGAIIGGYADAPWELRATHSHGAFHGSAQACLFSFSIPGGNTDDTVDSCGGTAQASSSKHANPTPSTNLKVFHWTGANRYIQYTDTNENKRMLAFGGGGQEGAFGLCVEQDFQFGSTGPCDTFGNVSLCDQENFNILDMEIWGFLTGQF